MGKDWDRLGATVEAFTEAQVDGRTDYHGKGNAPFGGGGQRVRYGAAATSMQEWHHAWATEALRVLKPGAHLLAFGGTRTYHRLACAIEDAGFEIRDCLAWLYGSGFPKSLDVSKAIDKHAEVNIETHRRIAAVAEVIRTHREAKGMERAEVSQAVVGTPSGACWNWEHQQLPSVEMWPAIKATLGISAKFDGLIVGDRAQFIAAEREVVGKKALTKLNPYAFEPGHAGEVDVTAPATPDAERWQGWGTALKPAWESIVWAQKPHALSGVLVTIGSCLSELSAKGAGTPSTSSPSGSVAESGSAPSSVVAKSSTSDASSDPTGTSPSGSERTTNSNTVSSWQACWDEICELMNTSTTATTSAATTDLRTLSSCLEAIMADSTLASQGQTFIESSLALAVDNLFAAVLLSCRATHGLSALGLATANTPHSLREGADPEPNFEPIVLARKPLSERTVAANVQRWGTGALNIDGCRIGTTKDIPRAPSNRGGGPGFGRGKPQQDTDGGMDPNLGRWPPNVTMDTEAAAMLDAQTGELAPPGGPGRHATYASSGVTGWANGKPQGPLYLNESGGASRFLYVSKADREERNRGLGHMEPQFAATMNDGIGAREHSPDDPRAYTANTHPTVKPVALMSWLCRMVTPPKGTILDPFTGSGSTGMAALREGFEFIGIEREAEYVEIARARIIGDAPLFNVEVAT